MSGYFSKNPEVSLLNILEVLITKTTILQFYNPEFLRGYGDGVLNGSLWTITVELQFYILLPIIYLIFLKVGSNSKILWLIGAFVLVNAFYDFLHTDFSKNITFKLFHVSFAPWFFILYILISFLAKPLNADYGNSLNPIIFFLLSCLIFSAAYSPVMLSNKLIGNTDISYGTYLYHMPIINFFLYMGFPKNYSLGALIFALTIAVSIVSWFLIEKPSLNFVKKLKIN
jgi:peptidoglycan/LPS O-acetylase OafA/YrhL